MCGLVGVAGNLYQKDLNYFHEGLWAGALRGMHSTGIFTIPSTGDPEVIKTSGTPLHLRMEKGKELSKITCGNKLLLGHNRHATIGDITDDNAHPFDFPRVAGAHNGTLRGRSDSKLEHRKAFGTDSEALYFNINNHGIESVIPEMEGAWALVWYNKEDDTLNFLRNGERPLSYAFSKNGQTLYWASEGSMLRWLMKRNNIEMHESGILTLKVDTHVSWKMPKGFTAFGEPNITELKGWERPASDTFFRREFEGTLEKWAPRHIPQLDYRGPARDPMTGATVPTTSSLVKPNGTDSSKRKPNDGPQSADVVKPASKAVKVISPGTTKAMEPFTRQAYENGYKAGESGKSVRQNPHPPLSLLGQSWIRGRNAGLDALQDIQKNLMKPGASNPESSEDLLAAVQEGKLMRAFNSEFISEKIWKARTKGCCAWCGDPTEWRDMVDARWVSRDTYVCEPCVSQSKTVQEILDPIKKSA